ncbi:MAG: hypothetical protein HC892_00050 [Saprospiraceae bacterium]|nr:hypothetical protein [Saprospiraceae bacterium]
MLTVEMLNTKKIIGVMLDIIYKKIIEDPATFYNLFFVEGKISESSFRSLYYSDDYGYPEVLVGIKVPDFVVHKSMAEINLIYRRERQAIEELEMVVSIARYLIEVEGYRFTRTVNLDNRVRYIIMKDGQPLDTYKSPKVAIIFACLIASQGGNSECKAWVEKLANWILPQLDVFPRRGDIVVKIRIRQIAHGIFYLKLLIRIINWL